MYRRTLSILALLLCLGFAGNALAQTITGRISGTITDSAGSTVPGATIIITNEATQQSRNAMADSNGFYVATNLPVGNYSVSVEHQGFKRSKKTGYNLVADGRLSVDFTLEAGAVTESVEIVASTGETVNSVSGEVSRTIDQSQVQELALNGRNYLQLTTLIPGAPLLEDNALSLTTSLSVSQPINGKTIDFDYDGSDIRSKSRAYEGRVFIPTKVLEQGRPVPMVVFFHGLNKALTPHRWMGGGQEGDIRRIILEMVDAGDIPPVIVAGPGSIEPAAVSVGSSFPVFDLDKFVYLSRKAIAGIAEIDETRIIVSGHSGAGCTALTAMRASSTHGEPYLWW